MLPIITKLGGNVAILTLLTSTKTANDNSFKALINYACKDKSKTANNVSSTLRPEIGEH